MDTWNGDFVGGEDKGVFLKQILKKLSVKYNIYRKVYKNYKCRA